MATQNQYLLDYLQNGNTITAREAFAKHGIQQLGRCIDDLQKEGHTIKRRWKKVPTRHGDGTTKVKEYWLADVEEQGEMFSMSKPNNGVYSR